MDLRNRKPVRGLSALQIVKMKQRGWNLLTMHGSIRGLMSPRGTQFEARYTRFGIAVWPKVERIPNQFL